MSMCMMMLQVAQGLELVGGATESIFPQVEALLFSGQGYSEALEYVAARKKMDRYRSVLDFLFCELHPDFKMSCRRFYAGNGPMLKEQITPEQFIEFNDRLLVALYLAHKLCTEEIRIRDWTSFHKRVEEEMRMAA